MSGTDLTVLRGADPLGIRVPIGDTQQIGILTPRMRITDHPAPEFATGGFTEGDHPRTRQWGVRRQNQPEV
jgi:hypothetical protein